MKTNCSISHNHSKETQSLTAKIENRSPIIKLQDMMSKDSNRKCSFLKSSVTLQADMDS